MGDTGVVTQAQARAALAAPGPADPPHPEVPTGTYFADWVAPAGGRRVRNRLRRGQGRRPRSTPICSGSPRGRSAMRRSRPACRRRWWRCAPTAGSSRWSAAARYKESPFNRATQARRQPGSAFKLFVYLAALRAGYRPIRSSKTGRSRSTAGARPTATACFAARHPAAGLCPVQQRRHRPPVGRGRPRAMSCAPRASSASPPRCPIRPASRSAPPGSACSN